MSTFILIHGAYHGAWCWYKVIPLLSKAGHRVVAPDLPSLGRDTTPVQQVSLDSWTHTVCTVVEAQSEPVVLVGHSRGGLLLSAVAETLPDKIERLVYVTAALLGDGKSLRQLLVDDRTSQIIPNLVVAADGHSSWVRDEALREVFYGESPDEDIALARLLVRPEARGPAGTAIHVTKENFGSVPRAYIECARDRAIPLQLQRAMQVDWPCDSVHTLDTDHSPFFSAPRQLAALLLSIASLTRGLNHACLHDRPQQRRA